MYAVGNRLQNFCLDYRNRSRATVQLIKQHMANDCLKLEVLQEKAMAYGFDLNWDEIFNEDTYTSVDDLIKISALLEIEISDIWVPAYKIEDEVKLRHMSEADGYLFPRSSQPQYKIYPLARTSKMPLMKGFNFHVLRRDFGDPFSTSLHTYIYNYGSETIRIRWTDDDSEFQDCLNPGDSMYLQPFIPAAPSMH